MTSFKLNFGKHRGTDVHHIPEGYLHWLIDSGVALRFGCEGAIQLELGRRASELEAYGKSMGIAPPLAGLGFVPIILEPEDGLVTPPGSYRSTPLSPSYATAPSFYVHPLISTRIPLPTAMPPRKTATTVPSPDAKQAQPQTQPKRSTTCWDLATKVMTSGFHVLLHGGIGLGKTTFALEAGLRKDEPSYGLTLTDGMTLGDMFGRFWLRNGSSEWVDGPATRALRAGSRLVLNEVEAASGEIMTALHALTDHPSIAMVALPNGEILRPSKGFRVVMTSNFVPSESLPAPLVDRAICIEIDSPHPDSVSALPEDLRSAAIASSINKDAKRRVSMRSWHHFAVLRKSIGEALAAEAVFADRAQDVLDAFAIRKGPTVSVANAAF